MKCKPEDFGTDKNSHDFYDTWKDYYLVCPGHHGKSKKSGKDRINSKDEHE